VSSPIFHRSGRLRVLLANPVLVELTTDDRTSDQHQSQPHEDEVRAQNQHPVDALVPHSSVRTSVASELLQGAQVFVAYRSIVRVLLVVSALTVLVGQAIGRDIVPPAIALAGVALAEVVCSFAASRAVSRFAVLGSVLGRGGDPLPWRVK